MKLLAIVFFSILSLGACAECYERLLGGSGADSSSFYMNVHEVTGGNSQYIDEASALNAVDVVVFKQLECAPQNLEAKLAGCSTELTKSPICKVDTKFGYFIVLNDYVDGVNVIFNRWD